MAMKSLVILDRITDRSTDSFKIYLSEIDKIERLTTDEEYNVAMRAFKGDEEAREELVRKNLRFVITVAKQYTNQNVKLEDLVNEGNHGLIKASKRFDPTKGFKFISYAVYWIRRDIIEYLTKYSRTIKISANKIALINPMRAIMEQLQQKLGRDPSDIEFYDVAIKEYSEKDIEFFLFLGRYNTTSVDDVVFGGESDSDRYILDNMVGDDFPQADHLVVESDDKIQIDRLLGLLNNDSQRTVITLLFGLDKDYPIEMKEVGEIMNISGERVRQIRNQALMILRNKAKELKLGYMLGK